MFLRYLVVNDHIPEPSIQKKIANYLITVFGQTQAHYLQQLPKMMPQWGKVHIRNGGDCIHAAIAQCDNQELQSLICTGALSISHHIFPTETSNNSMKHLFVRVHLRPGTYHILVLTEL